MFTKAYLLKTTLFLLFMLFVISFLSLCFGSRYISPKEVFENLYTGNSQNMAKEIVLKIRLPRVLLGIVIGAGLSVSGILFQSLLRNPLADPYLLGISSGSAFGIIVGVTTGLVLKTSMGLPFFSFMGAILAVSIIYFIATVSGRWSPFGILLSGIIVGAFFSSMILLFLYIVDPGSLHIVVSWLIGDLSGGDYAMLKLISPYVILGIACAYIMARPLNLLCLGEEHAFYLGVSPQRMRKLILVVGSMISAACVSATGPIGFIGLMVPHASRMIWGSDHRILIPAGALSGSIFLVFADMLSRSIASTGEVPVGIITALTGAPFFLFIFIRMGRDIYVHI